MIAVRYRRILLPLIGALVGWAAQIQPPDLYRFGQLGSQLTRGHLAQVYADPWNQAGPVQLLLARAVLVGGSDGNPAWFVVTALDAGLVLLAMRLCRQWETELLAGVSVVLWLGLQQPWNGHPIELLIPVGWVLALQAHRDGRWPLAVLALAGTLTIAPWGVLGFPALLAVADFRPALRTATLAVLLGALSFLPFVLTGHFALFSHHWPVDPDSAVHLLVPGLTRAGWPVRLAQAVITGAGCAWFARKSRGHPLALVAAPLVAALLRVVTDPVTFNYYWLSAAVLGVVAVTRLPRPDSPARWLGLLALIYLPWAMAATGSSVVGAQFIGGLACVGVVAVLVVPSSARSMRDDAGYGVPAHA